MTKLNPFQSLKPDEYGSSQGPTRPAQDPDPVPFDLSKTGLRLDKDLAKLQPGEAIDVQDVIVDRAGITVPEDLTEIGSAAGTPVQYLMPVDTNYKVRMLVRMRQNNWDRWDGGSWLQLPGSFKGHPDSQWMATIIQGVLVATNGVDQILYWNTRDNTGPAPLSADAPTCRFLVRLQNRLLAGAVSFTPGQDVDEAAVAWCEDGNIFGWTIVTNGAGAGSIPVSGSGTSAQKLRGMSVNERGAVLYRQKSIVMCIPTGLGDAPFTFQAVDFAHGTESPYSIANGGLGLGDIYLGEDYVVYFFDGASVPVPIGLPIAKELLDTVPDVSTAVGFIDSRTYRYVLLVSTSDSPQILDTAYIFDLYGYITTRNILGQIPTVRWMRRNFANGVCAPNFAYKIPFSVDPIVDTQSQIVDTDHTIVDDYAKNVITADRTAIADQNGQVYFFDPQNPLENGYILFGPIATEENLITVKWVNVHYNSDAAATIGITTSFDGGDTYEDEQMVDLDSTGSGGKTAKAFLYQTGRMASIRIKFYRGAPRITGVNVAVALKGRDTR